MSSGDLDFAPGGSRSRSASWREVGVAGGVTLATALVIAYAFDPVRAGDAGVLVAVGALYAALAAIAVWRLRVRGTLVREFAWAKGDITIGALTAGILYGLAMMAHLAVTARGTPREGWIVRIYLQVGPAAATNALSEPQRSPWIGVAIGLVAALEEITWRGLVQRGIEEPLGPRRALLTTCALVAAAHASTLVLLRDPIAGYNPLIVAAAFGCSVMWGGLALRTKRLVPSVLSHALFSWAIVEFAVWRP